MAYLPTHPTTEKMTPDKAISKLFYFHDQAHFNHLQTTSFARHKALNKLYQGLEEFKDSIAEILLGYIVPKRIGEIERIIIDKKMTDEKLLDELCKFADELYEYGEETKWWALSNKAADLSGLGYQTKYLLTLS